jgi:malonyl-CoA/methylmalonyl-CoA synthetase
MSGNLLHALYAERNPASAALSFTDGSVLSTGELSKNVALVAAALNELGIRPGDRVSFKLEKSPEVLFLAHACLQLGAIFNPLNTSYTDEELTYLVRDAEPKLLVCHPDEQWRLLEIARAAGARVATLAPGLEGFLGSHARALSPSKAIADVTPDAIAAILYTSGTTGKPKGACITHGNLAECARALARIWKLGPSDRLLHALPLYHAHGLLTAVNTLLVAGGSILFLPHVEPTEILSALPRATVMMGVPTHYARLLKEPDLALAITDQFRLAICGSAPLPIEVAERFHAVTGRRIIERYGSTEAAIITAVPAEISNRSGWVGWALPGVEIRARREDGSRADSEAVGGLETRGHNVFSGYWHCPEANTDAFTSDGWFITGDIAEIDKTGCVRLLGRSKDLIISGGLNVYPGEVEEVLDSLTGSSKSAVFGVPHPDFGEAVVAVVELGPEAEFDEQSLLRAVRQRIASYKVPKRILPVAVIPRNRMGKVLKNELRKVHHELFADGNRFVVHGE